jgi:acyl-CoA synthetase (AMP-forming)/AMP-acid ligase II
MRPSPASDHAPHIDTEKGCTVTNVITSPWPSPTVPDTSLPGFVMRDWTGRGDKPALVDASGGRTVSYADLAFHVSAVAAGLSRHGLRAGEVFALCCPNSPDFAIAYYAVLRAGGTVTTLSPHVAEAEAATQLADSRARWALTTPDVAPMLARAGGGSLRELFVGGGAMPAREPTSMACQARPEDPAVVLYSSGTTGLPKGVVLTHRNLVAGLCCLRAPEPVAADDVVLAVLPLSHIAGMEVVLNHALASGATVVTLPRFDVEAFLAAIERYRVTRMVVAPPIVLALAKHPLVESYDLSSLRVVASGAAPLGPDVARAAARRVGCRVKQGYGMTECVAVCMAPDDGPDKPESIGPPMPGVDCRVVDWVTGAEVRHGDAGELLVRSPARMRGYLRNNEATAAAVDPDGWLHTGDIVRVDADGWLRVVDRVKELIKYKGHQVAPAELEAVLLAHPAVADAAVVGCPDEEAGELPKALVVLRRPVEPAALLDFVAERVTPYKKIRRLEMVDEIPKSPSGKILRRVLAERERASAYAGSVRN